MSPESYTINEGEVRAIDSCSLVVDVTTREGRYAFEYSDHHPTECPLAPGDTLDVWNQPIKVSRESLRLSLMVGNSFDFTSTVSVIHSDKCDNCGLNKCDDPDATPKCYAATPQRGIRRQK